MATNAELLFATRTMLQAVMKIHTPALFLKKTFFPISQQVDTLHVELDEVVGNKKKAKFAHPQSQATVVQKQTMENKIWTPAFTNPSVQINAYEAASQRLPGQTVYDANNLISNAMSTLGSELANLANMITRTEEYACSEILRTGSLHIYGNGEDRTIDFGMPAEHKITLTGDDLFTSANSDPTAKLDNICTLVNNHIKNTLGPPDIAIMGRNVANAFLSHAKVIGQGSRFNNLGVQMGQIAPNDTENKVRYLGNVRIMNTIDLFSYTETYQDEDTGVSYDMIDPNYIFLGKRDSMNRFVNAGIADLDAGTANISDLVTVTPTPKTNIVATPKFPKTWREHNPSAQILMLQSSFLPLLIYPASFASVKAA